MPSRVEPVLADKEVLLTALNIKAMAFEVGADGNDDDTAPASGVADRDVSLFSIFR